MRGFYNEDGFRFVRTEGPDRPLVTNQHEPGVLPLLEGTGRTFLDVGAHHGKYAVRLSKRFRRVLAIEPDPVALPILRWNLELNGIQNVEIHVLAAWNRYEELLITPAYGQTRVRPDGTVKVPGMPLDDLATEVDLVKIDVEGAEANVLWGMRRILEEDRPRLVIEMHDRMFGPQIAFDVQEALEGAEYEWREAYDYSVDSHYWVAIPRG